MEHQVSRQNKFGMQEIKKIKCELRDEWILVASETVSDLTYCPLCGEEADN